MVGLLHFLAEKRHIFSSTRNSKMVPDCMLPYQHEFRAPDKKKKATITLTALIMHEQGHLMAQC